MERLSEHRSRSTAVDVQPVITDGLSAKAVETNVPVTPPLLQDGRELSGLLHIWKACSALCRVAVADQVGEILQARVVVNLIGERPGLSSGVGLSAYISL
ncbi:MAG: ethanolamine ammonia-lyase light chain EutC [Cyanobacteriota/Melainabacteria group bacterium]